MNYSVYLRDWYYNAGIIGFLNVLSEGEKNIQTIQKNFLNIITINDNYIDFESAILNDFFEKYKKMSFITLFDIDSYKERLNKLIDKLNQPNTKITKRLLQETALNGRIVNEFIKAINNGIDLNKIFSNNNDNNIINDLQTVQISLNQFKTNIDVYNNLLQNNKQNFIDYFLDIEVTRKICAYLNIKNYVNRLLEQLQVPTDNNRKCYICGEFKKEYDLSNAITQILGFNSDNSNWIWGYETSRVKICPLCALIYSCAFHGMVPIKRNVNGEYKNFLYFLNRNTSIQTLYNSYWIFKEKISQRENQNKPFYTIIQEVTLELINQQARTVLENINFIEIAENQFGGQSTKSYNVYNYNVTKELAEFIRSTGIENIPKGYYKDRDYYSDIAEEILKKTLEQTLNFSDLSSYYEYFLRSLDVRSKIIAHYSIYKVMKYVLKYIYKIKGGDQMTQEQIVNKAFYNGKELGQKIGQENKIKSIAYQLLNDLKISDRNAFMDKYLRLSMSYGSEVKFGSNNELTDIDNFMSFGYAFLNGLLSNINHEQNQEVQNG
ncbi:MAG: type I-B CRISPR-associated protein Cas8b1/Cst1 [Spirochaetota bacterium]|nr:type I-B CRISPR-associated protein Cas8b1/Cst1 [Spirochaetota bacterium]